jgi:type II secretory pathway pseudopilin PulG
MRTQRKEWKDMSKVEKTLGMVILIIIGIVVIGGIASLFGTSDKTVATKKPPTHNTSTTVQKQATTTKTPLDPAAVRTSLTKGTGYAQDLFNRGKTALGTYQYPDGSSGIDALNNDPSSPAAQWSVFNQGFDSDSAKQQMTAEKAYNEAANAYYNAGIAYPDALNDWDTVNGQTYTDISTWVQDATQWQISAIPTSQLNSDAQKVQQDFNVLQADIAKL